MKIQREQLLSVNGLGFAAKNNEMNDKQFDEYCDALLSFVEVFPSQETDLKSAFGANDYETFAKILASIRDELGKILAPGLAQSCERLKEELDGKKYAVVEAHLTYLLAEISSLSIDIQMAQHNGELPAGTKLITADKESVQKTILAVDDVSFLLTGLKTVLQNTSYKFTGVTSGEAALRYVDRFTPDLFILDIEMPEMNGYELAERLKKRGQKAPIIFLTGNATKEYVRKAIEVGAVDFIVKPVNREQVLEKISKFIGV